MNFDLMDPSLLEWNAEEKKQIAWSITKNRLRFIRPRFKRKSKWVFRFRLVSASNEKRNTKNFHKLIDEFPSLQLQYISVSISARSVLINLIEWTIDYSSQLLALKDEDCLHQLTSIRLTRSLHLSLFTNPSDILSSIGLYFLWSCFGQDFLH